MFKVIGLIVLGIFLMTFGTYFLSIADLPVLHLPDVNWTLVGFVTLIGSIVTFGSAFAVSRLAWEDAYVWDIVLVYFTGLRSNSSSLWTLVRSALSQYRLKFYRISGGTLNIVAIWMILLLYRRNRSIIVYDLHWVSIEIEGLKGRSIVFWSIT